MEYSFQLFDTMRRELAPLTPSASGRVLLYTCGPTVYGPPHIGNYRTYIVEDLLVRVLRHGGQEVQWAMNITDVGHLTSDEDSGEDKMEIGARREGKTAWDVALQYEMLFFSDLQMLHVTRPDVVVRATDTIAEQIAFIQVLEKQGFVYSTADGVYFDTSKLATYGKLARLNAHGNQAGIRVAMSQKRNSTDFALWKFSPTNTKRDMEWESPWGKGFPGWHIECSAIIEKVFGETLTIHAGGVDHIPVHHTNEIAQSETCTGRVLAHHWMHTEFLTVEGEKISKSLGNGITLDELQARSISPEALRLFIYSAHYRSKQNVTWEALEASQQSLIRLRRLASEGGDQQGEVSDFVNQITEALSDDLNTAKALASLWSLVRIRISEERQEELQKIDSILQLNLIPDQEVYPTEVGVLLEERAAARQAKKWSESDRLRDQLEQAGYSVRDTAEGQVLDKI